MLVRGKVYGESLRLGSEFTKLIAHYDFRLDGSVAPCFRIACVATQMSSPNQVDGVARLIFKSDLDAAKTKRKAELEEAEESLRDAWHVAQLALYLPHAKRNEIFGRFCVRMVLFVLRKQGKGQEKKEWESFSAIRDAFAEELMRKKSSSEGSAAASQGTAAASVPAASTDVVNMVDASKASILLLQHSHLEVGSNYMNDDHGNKVWTLTAVSDDGCTCLGCMFDVFRPACTCNGSLHIHQTSCSGSNISLCASQRSPCQRMLRS